MKFLGTISIFGMQARYNLQNGMGNGNNCPQDQNNYLENICLILWIRPRKKYFYYLGVIPLLTTKRVFWKGIVEVIKF